MKLGEEAGDEDVKKGEEKEGELLADSFDLRDLINTCLKYSRCPRSPPHKGRCPRKKIRVKVWPFAKPGGSHRVVKCQTSILEKYFFS